jgi:hypothetical protein
VPSGAPTIVVVDCAPARRGDGATTDAADATTATHIDTAMKR